MPSSETPTERRGVFIRNQAAEPHQLDETIENLILEIRTATVGDEIHTNAVLSLKVLMELRAADKAARKTVSPDAIASVVGHLAGILAILTFEKANVVTSKAVGFVPKIRT